MIKCFCKDTIGHDLKGLILLLSKRIPLTNESGRSFYYFIKVIFEDYLAILRNNAGIIEKMVIESNEIKENYSSNFFNLIKQIQDTSLKCLVLCYNGKNVDACNYLNHFLTCPNIANLNDIIANYLKFDLDCNTKFYRVRDFDEKETIDNCFHIPFHLRKYACNMRFNNMGYPCFYAASDMETAIA